MGGRLNLKSNFIINVASPGFETIAIAVYTVGNYVAANFCVARSGTGDLPK